MQATYTGYYEASIETNIIRKLNFQIYLSLVVLNTLYGEDKETRPEKAYLTIVAKIENFDQSRYWNYIVTNLVMLD